MREKPHMAWAHAHGQELNLQRGTARRRWRPRRLCVQVTFPDQHGHMNNPPERDPTVHPSGHPSNTRACNASAKRASSSPASGQTRGVRTGMALRHAVRARRLTGPASEAPPARAHTPHHLESSIDGLGVGRLAEESGRSRRRRTGGLAGTADRRRARAREAEVPRGPGGRGHAHVRPSMDHNLPGMGYCQLPLPASAGVSRGPHGARGRRSVPVVLAACSR